MRLPARSWRNVLAKLGYAKQSKQYKRKRRRVSSMESLEVRTMLAAQPIIIDDGYAGYSEVGSVAVPDGEGWNPDGWRMGELSGGYDGDYRPHPTGSSSDYATWSFTSLQPGVYDVYTTWVPYENRATNVPFTVYGDQSFQVRVDQTLSPGPDNWSYLGRATVTDGSLIVEVSGDAETGTSENLKYFIADAVKIMPVLSTVSIEALNSSVPENGGVGTFRISRSGPTDAPLTVNFSVGGSSTEIYKPATEEVDFTHLGTSVTIPVGASYVDFSFTAFDDSHYEGDEAVRVTLVELENSLYQPGSPSSAEIIIVDDDKPTVTIEAIQPTTDELSQSPGQFRISRNFAASTPLRVNYTISGDATYGADYEELPNVVGLSGYVDIPANSADIVLDIVAIADLKIEPSELVTLTLTQNESDYQLGDSSSDSVTIEGEENTKNRDRNSTGYGETTVGDSQGSVSVGAGTYRDAPSANDYDCGCATAPSDTPSFQVGTNPHPLLTATLRLPADQAVPDMIEAQLTFGGIQGAKVYYSTEGLQPGDVVRVVLQADATPLPSGRHDYQIDVTMRRGATATTSTFTGSHEIFNWIDSPFGNRRWIESLDQIVASAGGVELIRGDATAAWFAADGQGGYLTPAGSFSVLTQNANGSYTLRYKDGSRQDFDATGLLTARVDRNGNQKTYAYTDSNNDGQLDRLASITDAHGRTTTYGYTGGMLTSMTDHAGRTVTYEYTGTLLTKMTGPDPDGAGPESAPVTTYEFLPNGLLSQINGPDGRVRSISYNSAQRVESVSDAGDAWSLTAAQVQGLVDLASVGYDAAHPAPSSYLTAEEVAVHTDATGQQTRYRVDRFGKATEIVNAQGDTIEYMRNADGLIIQKIEPDPDGAGPLGRLVTDYEYDQYGNLTSIRYADGATEHWTYDPQFSVVTSHTDPLGRRTLYEIDPNNGNVLSTTRVVGELDSPFNGENDDVVWSFTYTTAADAVPAGLMTTEIDPLGRITQYEYYTNPQSHDFGRLKKITYAVVTADQAFEQFEYDEAGNITAVIDELGRRTDYQYDALDRLVQMTGPDPDGAGPQSRPVTQYKYDHDGNLLQEIDPLGNVSDYVYDDRGRLVRLIAPQANITDPAGVATVEDGDIGYTEIGEWKTGNAPGGHDGDHRVAFAGTGTSKASWEFTGLVPGATYEVVVTWVPYDNRATDAPYRLYDGNALTATSRVNQQLAPNDFTFAGESWESLGVITTENGAIRVELSNAANGVVVADAVRLIQVVDSAQIADDGEANYSETGTWSVGSMTGGYQGDYRAAASGVGNDTASWIFEGLEIGATYEVLATWVSGENRATNAPYEIYDGDQFVSRRRVDQQIAPADVTRNGQTWESLGIVTVEDGTVRVTLTNDADGYVIADAVRLVRASDVPRVVDDGDAGYEDSGDLGQGDIAGAFGGDYRFIPPGAVDSYAQWTFDGLAPGGTYEVFATWTPAINRSASATFELYDGTALDATAVVNQVNTPNDLKVDDVPWESLGTVQVEAGMLRVRLSGAADGYTVADAIRIVRIGGEERATTIMDYDEHGNLIRHVDPLGRQTDYEYDSLHRLTKIIGPDPDGDGPQERPVMVYSYLAACGCATSSARPQSVTDAKGNTTWYRYDARHRLVEMTSADPDGDGPLSSSAISFVYDAAGQLIEEVDALGRSTQYEYDDLGRLVKLIEPDPDGAGSLSSPITSYTYDALGNLLSVTDAEGNVTSYEYDHRNRLTQVTLPDPDDSGAATSPTLQYGYDAAGQLTSTTDPLGQVTTYEYDALGRMIKLTLPDPDGDPNMGDAAPVTTWTYDLVGNVLSETDAAGQVTQYAYDNLYRLVQVTGADPDDAGPANSPVTSYRYDAAGQLIGVTDSLGRTTGYGYDEQGRQTRITRPDPDGSGPLARTVERFSYDSVGNLLTHADGLGHTTSYAYDNLYRLISETNANGDSTSFAYDAVGNLVQLVDPVQNVTQFAYDNLDRLTSETNQLGHTRFYAYDLVGNLVQKTDRNGRVTEYEYDNLYRRTAENWLDDLGATSRSFSYTYDAAGRLRQVSDPDATYSYMYDNIGRNTSVMFEVAGLEPSVVLAYAYDALSRRTAVYTTIGSTTDYQNHYQYDHLNRLTQLTQSGSNGTSEKRIDFAYDAEGRWDIISRYADLAGTKLIATSDYSFDQAGRLTGLTHSQGATTLVDYQWRYDAAGRLTQYVNSIDGTADYNYDSTGQLTGADYDYQSDESYTYDANGNRTNTGYSTGTNNRLLSDGTYSYEYDHEGNRTRRVHLPTGATTVYSWDHRNRLVKVAEYAGEADADLEQNSLQTVEHTYDAFNQWISRTVDTDGDSGTAAVEKTFFLYDQGQIVLQFDKTGTGDATTSDLSHRYLWGDAVDQLLADESATGEVLWSLADHLGTVRDLAEFNDNTAVTTIANHRTYDAFGNFTGETNAAVDSLFGYTGRPLDEATGLQNNLHRWYDAQVGRWISEDPIGFEAGDANLFRYVRNVVTSIVDPSGLAPPNLGIASQWFYDTAEANKHNPLIHIPAGMMVGPAALFDALPWAIHDSASEAREKIKSNIRNTNDPIQKTMGCIAYAYTIPGEISAQWANGEGAFNVVAAPFRGAYGLYNGGRALETPQLYAYSKEPWHGEEFIADAGGRVYASSIAPTGWHEARGVLPTLQRWVYLGRPDRRPYVRALTPGEMAQMRPLAPNSFQNLLWKRPIGQYSTTCPGNMVFGTGVIQPPSLMQRGRFLFNEYGEQVLVGAFAGAINNEYMKIQRELMHQEELAKQYAQELLRSRQR